MDVDDAVIEVTHALRMVSANTLFAHSVCPDEINHEDNDITDCLRNHFDSVFSLGGLGGIPFSGMTGFNAYAAHVPDDGNIFVLFAPHCAISSEGKCGYYHRRGQEELTTACGAAIGAYNQVKDLENVADIDTLSRDFQMQYIKRLVWKQRERITAAKEPIAELTYVMFDHIKDYITDVVCKRPLGNGKIAILGGIQINIGPN